MLLARNRNYRLLFSATAVSNLGDGISALAFPWLATLLTRDPVLIAAVAAAGRLPWLLFTAPAGVITDRASRQALMVWSDVVRAALTCAVILLILSIPDIEAGASNVTVWALAALAFLLGMAEVLRDNAAQTALPSLVDKADLENANGQLWSVEQIMGSFVGPPLAGVLIAIAVPMPFAFDALSFALAAGLVACITFPERAARAATQSVFRDLRDGAVWLWQHKTILQLAVLLGVINAATAGYATLLVLYAQEVLGLNAAGFGLLMMAGAAGGVAGGILGPHLVRRFGGQAMFLGAQILFLADPLAVYFTSSISIVAVGLFIAMFASVTYNIVTVSYRQRVIPDDLLGRVNSLYRLFGWGMMPLGILAAGAMVSLTEGAMGREDALRLPFAVGGVVLFAMFLYSAARIRIPPRR
ncbi:MFS transporter [uncultured Tateyamaria sp.]|uniref:MFS transporter n=1 Tax=uncultured Tateyamaria sp. TaxID=455651 RepID=UPI00261620D0|nr:MFS transporter [uncultured Tateyamaria sp.]